MNIAQALEHSIILSVKPKYSKLISRYEKIYEYRNFIPKNPTKFFLIYESKPTCALRYICRVEDPVQYPNKILDKSYGTDRFNTGEINYKYAYKIVELYRFNQPLPYNFLKKHFNFTAPQAYTYLNNNIELKNYIMDNVQLNKV